MSTLFDEYTDFTFSRMEFTHNICQCISSSHKCFVVLVKRIFWVEKSTLKLPEKLMLNYDREKFLFQSFFFCSLRLSLPTLRYFFDVFSAITKWCAQSKYSSHCSQNAYEMYAKLLKFGLGLRKLIREKETGWVSEAGVRECVCVYIYLVLCDACFTWCQQWVLKVTFACYLRVNFCGYMLFRSEKNFCWTLRQRPIHLYR